MVQDSLNQDTVNQDSLDQDALDQDALDKLLHVLGGDPDDLYELIEIFATTGPKLISELGQAATACDWKSMRVSSHSLKSNARDFGARELAELCQALEHQCKESEVSQPQQQIVRIEAAFDLALKSLLEIKDNRA